MWAQGSYFLKATSPRAFKTSDFLRIPATRVQNTFSTNSQLLLGPPMKNYTGSKSLGLGLLTRSQGKDTKTSFLHIAEVQVSLTRAQIFEPLQAATSWDVKVSKILATGISQALTLVEAQPDCSVQPNWWEAERMSRI